jgi:hypothetical protein
VGVMFFIPLLVRVGIMVTHNPLYRSQRAGLPHWALTLGSDVQAKICLPYPLQLTLQARRINAGASHWLYPWFPTSCPFRVLHIDPSPGPESGACFARTNSPWSGPFPPPPPPAGFSPAFVQRSLRYLWACPTSHVRSSPSCSFRIPGASPRAISQGQAWDLPVPVQRVSVRARGLRPRRASPSLALAGRTVLPSAFDDTVGTPKHTYFRGSIPGPHFPLSTLRLHSRGRLRMTRGRCGSLGLHRMELSSTTLCRFLPAHHQLG